MSDEKQTDRDEEREDVAQDLELPDETAEQVKGGQQKPEKWSKQK